MKWSFYDADDVLKPWSFSGPAHLVAANTPAGCTAIEGAFDHLSKRVVDGVVIDYIPEKPDGNAFFDWELVSGRWAKVLTFEGKRQASIDSLRSEILRIEAGTDRALRQLVLSTPGHPAAARMQAIEDAVEPIRLAINEAAAAETVEELEAIRAARP